MGYMKRAAQGVSQCVGQPQPRVVKGQSCHGCCQMNITPSLRLACKRSGQQFQKHPAGFACQCVCDQTVLPGSHGLHAVADGVHAAFRDQMHRQLLQKRGIQNGVVRPNGLVDEGVLDPVVGQNGEGRHLRTRAGSGGDGHEHWPFLRCQQNTLGAVQTAAAPQGDHQIRLQLFQHSRPFGCQRRRRIRLHLIENVRIFAAGSGQNRPGQTRLGKEFVRHQQNLLRPQGAQEIQAVRAGNQFRSAGKLFQITTAFSLSISQF